MWPPPPPPPPPPPTWQPDPGWSRPAWTGEPPQRPSRRRVLGVLGGAAAIVALVTVLALIGDNPPHIGGNGESLKRTEMILADSGDALASTTYVHIWGSEGSGADADSLDLDMGTGWTTGTVTTKGVTAQVMVVGDDLYLRGHDFIATFAGQDAADTIGDRWIHPPSMAALPGSQYLKLDGIHQVFDDMAASDETMGRGGTVHDQGRLAFELRDRSATVDIAADGAPFPLRIQGVVDDQSFDLHFGDFNRAIPAPTPPSDVFGAPGPLSL